MRILIDMQGAQTDSRFRGIGRYTLALTRAIVRQKRDHEVFLVLNGLFEDTIPSIREAFEDLLSPEYFRIWIAPDRVPGECEPDPTAKRPLAEFLREDFMARLAPDVILVTSLFEGYVDPAVISIGEHYPEIPTACIFYDLIPLLNPEIYLDPNPVFAEAYRRKVEYLGNAALCLGISESACSEGANILGIPPHRLVNISTACDEHFKPLKFSPSARKSFLNSYGIHGKFVLYTGGADPRKNLLRLVRAFANLPEKLRLSHQLVFAGKMPAENAKEIQQTAEACFLAPDRLVLTGFISDQDLVTFYNLAETFVFPSIHEGFGLPALEAMSCGAVVIASNTTSIPEVVGLDEAMFDPLDEEAITASLVSSLTNRGFRSRSKDNAIRRAKLFSWDTSAQTALNAFEDRLGSPQKAIKPPRHQNLLAGVARLTPPDSAPDDLTATSDAIAQNLNQGLVRQLFLDISELCHNDAASGVQRVVRSYLHHLNLHPPKDFRVEPVYASVTDGYRYANRFMDRMRGNKHSNAIDDPISYQRGDVFFVLDLQHYTQIAQRNFYAQLRRHGVTVKFLIYDLLPIEFESLFHDPELARLHADLLTVVSENDGAICISDATRGAYLDWLKDQRIETPPHFTLDVVHIGADLEGSNPSKGMPSDGKALLKRLRQRTTFLQVSTLEPRKAQNQVLGAFERLWARGVDANLVFVGHSGWQTETLANMILKHPEMGHRLFWLKSISDEYLEEIYKVSDCLIAPSLNEGFGLSLIEAARHQIPIIARDIPVFREVAGGAAFFFTGKEEESLADAVCAWIELKRKGEHPRSEDMAFLSWEESANKLKSVLTTNPFPKKQILLDISALTLTHPLSTSHRAVRELLVEALIAPPKGYRVEPIYAPDERGYRYARRFTMGLMGTLEVEPLQEDRIEFSPGDLFLGLDTPREHQQKHKEYYQFLRSRGVRVEFPGVDQPKPQNARFWNNMGLPD